VAHCAYRSGTASRRKPDASNASFTAPLNRFGSPRDAADFPADLYAFADLAHRQRVGHLSNTQFQGKSCQPAQAGERRET
jgi:hypothetical protein